MRVIAGRAKGRRLKGPPAARHRGQAATTRPSSDLVRGAVFSALGSIEANLGRVLDLYAGSGALGIEALSRGAGWCDFVERDARACTVIRENLRLTGFEEQSHVYQASVEKALERLEGIYTLVLADPPYSDAQAAAALRRLAASGHVEPGCTVIVVEHSAREEPEGQVGPFTLLNVRRHGDSAVSIYR